jgi:transcriptional regulator with XRE-family HTH domain
MALRLDYAKLKKLRADKGWSMREAGERAELGKNPAQRWNALESGERVNVELSTLTKLGAALGVDGRELITDKR